MKSFALATTVFLAATTSVEACTGMTVKAKDGGVAFGRTMEFGADLQSNVIVVPRNYELKAIGPNNSTGLTWKTKYAAVGANGLNRAIIVDGLNEKGLAVGSFYYPEFAKYQEVTANEYNQSLSSSDVGIWLLTNFASIDEVKAGIQKIKVSNAKFPVWNFTLPLHYIVTESSGKSLVIEYTNGKLHIFDNPIGVLTNAPSFDWQITNLMNYVNLKSQDVEKLQLNEQLTLRSTGLGSGMLGLPGDFTPPSRFVRSAFFSSFIVPVDTSKDAIYQLFHTLNNFDIPKGVVQETYKGQPMYDITQWTSANDLKNQRFYFKTYDDQSIRVVDLVKFDKNAKEIKVISMAGETPIRDVSEQAKQYSPQ